MPYEKLRETILWSAKHGWGQVMNNEKKEGINVKKDFPRSAWDQFGYKVKKLFTSGRAPDNTLVLYNRSGDTWFRCDNHAGVHVFVQVLILPLEGENFERLNFVNAKLQIDPPTAHLTLGIQGKHFYDDQAHKECPEIEKQVKEKFGKNYYQGQHITKWPPSKAFVTTFLEDQYRVLTRQKRKYNPHEESIDFAESEAKAFNERYWYH